MPAWFLTFIMGCFLMAAPFAVAADNTSVGQTFGDVGRAIADDSRSAYDASKDFVLETGQSISEGAQEAYEEAKQVGPKMADDIKKDFQKGGGQAPDPTKEPAPAAEKP